jgi:salicylate synthetase
VLDHGKLSHEHRTSIQLLSKRLSMLGATRHSRPRLLRLARGQVCHLMTILSVRPPQEAGIGACLDAVFPSGVSPYPDGVRLLSQLESQGRGAYYGLIGMIDPQGHFEFCQTLRAAFRDETGPHIWVGAAVTRNSDPNEELQETRIKLSNCPRIHIQE